MDSKPALIFLATLLLIKLTFVLCGKHAAKDGRSTIIKGEHPQPPAPPDTLLFRDIAVQSDVMMRKKGNEYCYPSQGSTDEVKITRYEVINQETGKNAGLAYEVSGGVGLGQVCIYLKTRRKGGYRFEVNVFGYRLPPRDSFPVANAQPQTKEEPKKEEPKKEEPKPKEETKQPPKEEKKVEPPPKPKEEKAPPPKAENKPDANTTPQQSAANVQPQQTAANVQPPQQTAANVQPQAMGGMLHPLAMGGIVHPLAFVHPMALMGGYMHPLAMPGTMLPQPHPQPQPSQPQQPGVSISINIPQDGNDGQKSSSGDKKESNGVQSTGKSGKVR